MMDDVTIKGDRHSPLDIDPYSGVQTWFTVNSKTAEGSMHFYKDKPIFYPSFPIRYNIGTLIKPAKMLLFFPVVK
jgi:hypothetical protein